VIGHQTRFRTLAVALAGALLVALALALTANGSTATTATVKTRTTALGKILVNAQGRSLYLFEKDKGSQSSCYSQCAKFWPPLLTTGKPIAAAGAKAGLLGTTKRTNGTVQVTYAGHPLYLFVEDKQAGQTKGEGSKAFGASWYVLMPSGKKIDKD